MKNKSGLSAVVTNLIIILLVIVAVGIVWFVINNLIGETTEGIDIGKITLGMEIQSVTQTATNVSVLVQRTSGEGNLSAVKFLVYNADGDSESFEEVSTMDELETQRFVLDYDQTANGDVVRVEVAPIITIEGKQKTGDVANEYVLADYE